MSCYQLIYFSCAKLHKKNISKRSGNKTIGGISVLSGISNFGGHLGGHLEFLRMPPGMANDPGSLTNYRPLPIFWYITCLVNRQVRPAPKIEDFSGNNHLTIYDIDC